MIILLLTGSSLAIYYADRDVRPRREAAELEAQENFKNSSTGKSWQEMLVEIGLSKDDLDKGYKILEILCESIKSPFICPSPSLSLSDIFLTYQEHDQYYSIVYIETFIDSLFKVFDRKLIEKEIKENKNYPKSEYEFENLIRTMDIKSLILYFIKFIR